MDVFLRKTVDTMGLIFALKIIKLINLRIDLKTEPYNWYCLL